MSKKHFIELADTVRGISQQLTAINRENAGGSYDVPDQSADALTDQMMDMIMRRLSDFCSDQNPRFDHHRWIGYIKGECGPNGGAR